MATSILRSPAGACYLEHATEDGIYTEGPYSEPVARYLAGPDARLDNAPAWSDSLQRAQSNATDD